MDLATFLRAQLDEDEREASQFVDEPLHGYELEYRCAEPDEPWYEYLRIPQRRALADIKAKRQIIDLVCDPLGDEWTGDPYRDGVLQLLALPYIDHPNYREEWRP